MENGRKDKDIEWIGSSLKDLTDMPDPVKRTFGYGLRLAQKGQRHPDSKNLEDSIELIEDHDTDTYRAVYTTKIDDRIYVLHCFQKKSTRGIGIPKHHLNTIKLRFTEAKRLADERRRTAKKGN